MEPQLNREPALHLPQPISEQHPLGAQPENVAVPESASSPSQGAPALTFGQAAVPQPMPLPQAAPAQMMPVASSPQQAAPVRATPPTDDEIDRVWVAKARRIVEQTHADPFLESQEIGKAKVEYLKTRYNKDVKVAESKS